MLIDTVHLCGVSIYTYNILYILYMDNMSIILHMLVDRCMFITLRGDMFVLVHGLMFGSKDWTSGVKLVDTMFPVSKNRDLTWGYCVYIYIQYIHIYTFIHGDKICYGCIMGTSNHKQLRGISNKILTISSMILNHHSPWLQSTSRCLWREVVSPFSI